MDSKDKYRPYLAHKKVIQISLYFSNSGNKMLWFYIVNFSNDFHIYYFISLPSTVLFGRQNIYKREGGKNKYKKSNDPGAGVGFAMSRHIIELAHFHFSHL